MEKIPIVVIVGPTACGKTDLSLDICKGFDGEVVSADSMQIYKKLDVGTAKPTKEQLNKIPHHMIDILEPYQCFSVADYCLLAHKEISRIAQKGKLPVVVGGTGLYVDSLVNNIKFHDDIIPKDTLKKAENLTQEEIDSILSKMEALDPKTANRYKKERNKRHIVRDFEIITKTGKTMDEYLSETQQGESIYQPIYIGLNYKDRALLYDRINKRVELMIEEGLLSEAELVMGLSDDVTAKSAIGYKELFPYLRGEKKLCECVEDLKKASRHYAKRQLTWFRKNKAINWIYIDEVKGYSSSCDNREVYNIAVKIIKDMGYIL